jgi:hypothetical protein
MTMLQEPGESGKENGDVWLIHSAWQKGIGGEYTGFQNGW